MSRCAVGLFSGGLDSLLAYKIVERLGIKAKGLFIATPFLSPNKAIEVADRYNVDLEVVNAGREYIDVLLNPSYGYGSAFNPCVDCHRFMVDSALRYMRDNGYDFIFSGEVVGQRPFSQNRRILHKAYSDIEGLLLRPLSALLLGPTIPELKGWIDRSRLYGISGRSRKEQQRLAMEFGIEPKGLLQPSGGCCLTDKVVGSRIRMYFSEMGREWPYPAARVGRHFINKINANHYGLVLGRNQEENLFIKKIRYNRGVILEIIDPPGPTGLLFTAGNAMDLIQDAVPWALDVASAYADGDVGKDVKVSVFFQGETKEARVKKSQRDNVLVYNIDSKIKKQKSKKR